MREHIRKPEIRSGIADRVSKASGQASIPEILQAYKKEHPGAEPIQMYTNTAKGKVSANEKLLLENPQTLYAADDQFTQANGIPETNFQFVKGAAHVTYHTMKEVVVEVKPGSMLQTTTEDYLKEEKNEQNQPLDNFSQYEQIVANTRESFVSTQLNAYEDQIEKQGNQLTPQERQTKRTELEQSFAESIAHQNLLQYLQNEKQLAAAGRILTLSDCRGMAAEVCGFDVGDESLPAIHRDAEPGYGYSSTPQDITDSAWTGHFAGIIMADGPDHVTLENAGAKASEEFNKLQFDHGWYFGMYGNTEGQTFHDTYKDDLGGAPTTKLVKRPEPKPE